MKSHDEHEVEALMQRYFDGLYASDSAKLRTVFHPDLAYVNATPGAYEVMDLEAYMTRVDNRTSPAALGEPRDGVIDRISLKEGQMGVVEARARMLRRDYQDLLTLVRTDDGWKVRTKIFLYRELKD